MHAQWLKTFSQVFRQVFIMMSLSLVLLSCLMFSGCGQKAYEDPFKKYRKMTAQQLFDGANAAVVKKHYSDGVKQYSALDAMYPFGQYTQQALLYTIYANYKNSDIKYLKCKFFINIFAQSVFEYLLGELHNFIFFKECFKIISMLYFIIKRSVARVFHHYYNMFFFYKRLNKLYDVWMLKFFQKSNLI
jgi:hypothetical protein